MNPTAMLRTFCDAVERRDGKLLHVDRAGHPSVSSFFNTDDTSAALILRDYPISAGDDGQPHILVAHLDPLGQQLIVLAAQEWVSQRKHGELTREMPLVVTVVDDGAAAAVRALKREHAVLRDACTFVTTASSAGSIGELKDEYARAGHPNPTRAYVAANEIVAMAFGLPFATIISAGSPPIHPMVRPSRAP